MSQPTAPPLGRRIRAERTRRGMSVRGLARDIGVSPSLISQIETDKSQPSVSTLYAITTALDITIEELFGEPRGPGEEGQDLSAGEARESAAPSPRRLGGLAVHLPAPPSRTAGAPDRASGRTRGADPRLRRDVGAARRGAAHARRFPVDHLSTREHLVELGRAHAALRDRVRLPAVRLAGVDVGFRRVRLSAGDAVSFDSTTPHGYRNDGVEPAVGVWFVLERV